MYMCRLLLVLWLSVLGVSSSPVEAQDGSQSLSKTEIDTELNRILDVYSGIRSSRLERVLSTKAGVHSQSLVFRDGEFFVISWQTRQEDDSEQLTSFVHVTDGTLRSMHGPPRYIEGEIPPDYFDPPGPVHHWENPWPLLQEWCFALGNSADITGTMTNGILSLESETLGLSLAFGPSLECRVVEVFRDPVRTRFIFSDYDKVSDERWPAPGRLQRVFTLDPDDPSKTRIDEWEIINITFNNDDKEESLAWDSDKLGVYRLVPSTGNVYASDGSLMYNETEYAEKALGMQGIGRASQRWLVPGLVGLALVSGALAYWRFRR